MAVKHWALVWKCPNYEMREENDTDPTESPRMIEIEEELMARVIREIIEDYLTVFRWS